MDAKITIIGAGVIGLAIAERLSEKHRDVFLVEKNPFFGQETSSRNSEVIHAGIYYPKGSLKARLCVEGKNLLYDFCKKWDVTFSNCGKLIVATSEDELKVLAGIKATAAGNGVDLTMIDRDQISRLEPNDASCFSIASFAPVPIASMAMTAATPIRMPRIDKNERIL